ncbi:MAG: membrane-associated phospholipid phosphatase [Crocinitomicaceae bacterium]|jgi:membrane-associated phospholipid phosphatase
MHSLVEFHNNIFFALHSITEISPLLNYWIYFIAERLDLYVVLISVLFVLLHQHTRKGNIPRLLSRRSLAEGLYLSVGILLAWGIAYLIKIGFAIPRPFLQFPEIIPLFSYGGFNSFPSGHATLFAGLATAISMVHRNIGIFFVLPAFLIGLTRIIAGVHFPIDILFGWILGSSISYLTYKFLTNKFKK